ncbi:MAG TPA: 3-dehydroquinate synthase [Firmicutes bacterium]|nr:3-dehydroquinate synthase [Bacillota bacterium]
MGSPMRIKAGSEEYPLYLAPGLLAAAGSLLREQGLAGKVLVVTNPKVGALYLSRLQAGLEAADFIVTTVTIPDGESYKRLDQLTKVYDAAVACRLERDSLVLALGGGVIGDLAGFAAATYLRGVKLVQVPTTLLAQVDSSIGGKVAVNHRAGKNLIGAFYQPTAVLSDPETLGTLDQREFKTGLAEIIKVGLIGDRELDAFLRQESAAVKQQQIGALLNIIRRACAFKARIVDEDVRESGQRVILNYGHTIGHALEAETDYDHFRHGEAVAIGMVGAAKLSVALGLATPELTQATLDLLGEYELPTAIPGLSAKKLMTRMAWDKKVKDGKLRFVLSPDLGKTLVKGDVPPKAILAVLRSMGAV